MTSPGPAGYPRMIAPVDHVEPVPRRVRGVVGDSVVVDTTAARYVWEWPNYPQFYVPLADVSTGVLVDENRTEEFSRGTAAWHGLQVGDQFRPAAACVYGSDAIPGVRDRVRFEWAALDAWYEEDEQVFVHPRNPYTRVDALRSTRSVRVERDGVLLAESEAPVLVFETGLPTRYYFDRTAVHFEQLVASDTVTPCPYKGVTSGYWSVRTPLDTYADLAWAYDFPTSALQPIAGLIAFYNEKVDIIVDGVAQPRPSTHFFS